MTAPTLRITPAALTDLLGGPARGGGRGRRLVERNLRVQRRTWWVITSGFVEPLLYLLSIGVGIGHLVGRIHGAGGTSFAYAAWVAPGLLASSAMNGGINESTFNVFHKLHYARIYDAVLTTPLGARDVATGEITSAVLRGTAYAAMFLGVMAALGDLASPWGVLAFPAAVLLCLAFSAVGMASTTWMRGWSDFELVQLAILPMFLFSTSFYPLATYPRWLQVVVECTPLYQGVALCRGLCLGQLSAGLAGHALYLALMALAGWVVSARRVATLLLG